MTHYKRADDGSLVAIKYDAKKKKENPRFPTPVKNRLFVYGIFLGPERRIDYGMSNARYATVKDYVTFGNHIVQAQKVEGVQNLALTGLTVDVDPACWDSIDALEAGYQRRLVKTDSHEEVYMYTVPDKEIWE